MKVSKPLKLSICEHLKNRKYEHNFSNEKMVFLRSNFIWKPFKLDAYEAQIEAQLQQMLTAD